MSIKNRVLENKLVKKRYNITNLEAAILLLHLHAALEIEEIGFVDINNSFNNLVKSCERKITSIDRDYLESLLWSANLMDELGYFWHPKGLTFDEFTKDLLTRFLKYKDRDKVYFDRFYNLVTEKGD